MFGTAIFVDGDTFTTTLGETEFLSPELPEWLEEFAERQSQGSRSIQATGGQGDAYSHGTDLGHLGWEHEVAFD